MPALIVYAPQRYKQSAQIIAAELERNGCKVLLKEAAETMIPDLAAAQLIVLGTLAEVETSDESVIGTGVHSDFAELYRALKGVNLAGRTAGIFAETPESQAGLVKSLEDTDVSLEEAGLLLVPAEGADRGDIAGWSKSLVSRVKG